MQHAAYIQLFEDLARQHYLLAHGMAGRRSFFRINGEAEMQLGLAGAGANFPALVLPRYFGRLESTDGLINDQMTGTFEIRDHVANQLDFDGIEAARDRCKDIGFNLVARMHRMMEEDGYCGPITDFDPGTVRYDFTGPVNTNEYGCRFSFDFTDEAYNPYSIDLDTLFPNI